MKSLSLLALPAAALLLGAAPAQVAPADAFMANLQSLCGKSFAGGVAHSDSVDASYAALPMVMGPVECAAGKVRIPYAIGEDHTRTWEISRTAAGLHLNHVHAPAGRIDPVNNYGGDTTEAGTAEVQTFPIDAASRALVTANNLPTSVDNVWTIEVHPGRSFAYVLQRPGRDLRVEFDLSKPAG